MKYKTIEKYVLKTVVLGMIMILLCGNVLGAESNVCLAPRTSIEEVVEALWAVHESRIERMKNVILVKEFFKRFPEINERLLENDTLKPYISKINEIVDNNLSQNQVRAILNFGSNARIGQIEKEILDIINTYRGGDGRMVESAFDGTFEYRKQQYLSNFKGAKYKYLLPEEERRILTEIAEEYSNNAKNILKFLREGNRGLGMVTVKNRFERCGIILLGSNAIRQAKARDTEPARELNLDEVTTLREVVDTFNKKLRLSTEIGLLVIDMSCLVYWDPVSKSIKKRCYRFMEAIEVLRKNNMALTEKRVILIVNIDQDIGKAGIDEVRNILGINKRQRLVFVYDFTIGGIYRISAGSKKFSFRAEIRSILNRLKGWNLTRLGRDNAMVICSDEADHSRIMNMSRYATVVEAEVSRSAGRVFSPTVFLYAFFAGRHSIFRKFTVKLRKKMKKAGLIVDLFDVKIRPVNVPLRDKTETCELSDDLLRSI